MHRLTINQTTTGADQYRVEVTLAGDGLPTPPAAADFAFALTAQDPEDLRWYLEDFIQYPLEPAPKIARRIEARMAEIGTELFDAVFAANDDLRYIWATVRDHLADTRVEIIADLHGAIATPWELLRDPQTDTALALHAGAFVRAQPDAARAPQVRETSAEPIRVLLVICRPGEADDVPFRSVATRLIKGLTEEARARFQLDVLRPPTFERLGQVLHAAKADDRPYHILHFDGHGTWGEPEGEPRPGSHGYLVFENPAADDNTQLVDGPTLGALLFENGVSALALLACRSAHADPSTQPDIVHDDLHSRFRAFGSLAQEVMAQGCPGVIAMRYNLYVATAADFVADLYAALTQGHTLGEAATLARKQLEASPSREIAFAPWPLQDWCVPVVYEAAPIALFATPEQPEKLDISLDEAADLPARGELDPDLPERPDVGFFGRDETLLALDRAFDTQSIVLLHAYAGSGKTTTAAEFARWYALTGGMDGPVLFTSFEQYKPLPRVLDEIGRMFGPALEAAGINWLALDDDDRRNVALQVLKQIPVLWIWDNVEPIAGFPEGTESTWSKPEQKELAGFLRAARATRAKFLLTSRRNEQRWLGELPSRITVPPMPMQERLQLTRALAEKRGHRLTDVEDWGPLLDFTQGNPLTITLLVAQALRDNRTTRQDIKDFVAQLRQGEARIDDVVSQGRAKSLAASLSYGFRHGFTETERKRLALLHFFQGFVDVDALVAMGHPDAEWRLPELKDLERNTGIALLDRAAEVGLLTAHGGGYYSIHPALPWYFKTLFDIYYADRELQATRAFVEATGELGNYYHSESQHGNPDVIAALSAEEANLLHARQLARAHGWWFPVLRTMQGLHTLYDHTGRRAEWARLVNEIVPDFVDPDTDGPLPGREEQWGFVTEYRVLLAVEVRDWANAERLEHLLVDSCRQRASEALAEPAEALSDAQRNIIRTLAASLHELALIDLHQGNPNCVEAFGEAAGLCQRIGDQAGEAAVASNLGHAYKDLPSLRDLDEAERWYTRSLQLRQESDRIGRAHCLGQLGSVAYERFRDARAANKPDEELLAHINAAADLDHEALHLFPADAINELARTRYRLGNIYGEAGDLDHALKHFRESIRYDEMQDNRYGAAQTRFNVAVTLLDAGRLADARDYAYAALRNYQEYGDRADDEIQETQRLIAGIEAAASSEQ